MKKPNSLVLDVDGTLWDSTDIVAVAWTKALQELGVQDMVLTSAQIKTLFGKQMNVIAYELFPEKEQEWRDRMMELCCKWEHKMLEEDTTDICYKGVADTIRTLSEEIPVCIVSNCQSGYIELFLEKTGLGPYITDKECYGNTLKSKGSNIALVAERNHLDSPAYVGDTQGDCDAAKEAGVPFIHAGYGFGTADHLDAQIQNFAELIDLIKKEN